MAFTALRHSNELYPRVDGCVLLHDIIRAVGRTVTDDDPFDWQHFLRNHGLNGQFNELGFVSCRRDKNVGGKGHGAQAATVEMGDCWSGAGKTESLKNEEIAKGIHAWDHLMYGVRM